jgi:hypothetical protein
MADGRSIRPKETTYPSDIYVSKTERARIAAQTAQRCVVAAGADFGSGWLAALASRNCYDVQQQNAIALGCHILCG